MSNPLSPPPTTPKAPDKIQLSGYDPLNLVPGYATAVNAAGQAVDIAQDQANQQQGTAGSSAQEVSVGPGGQPAIDATNALPAQVKEQQGAIKDIAGIQGPQLSKVGEKQLNLFLQQQSDALKQNQAALVDSQNQFTQLMQQKQSDLDNLRQQATINPQQAIQDKYFGSPTSAIATSLAMVLGGIGSAFTGKNAALDTYNNQVNNAIQIRSQNIQAYLQAAQSTQAGVDANLTKAQVVAISNSIAGATTFNTLKGIIDSMQTKLSGDTAKQNATILSTEAAKSAQQRELDLLNATKGTNAFTNARKWNAITSLLGGVDLTKPADSKQQLQLDQIGRDTLGISTPKQQQQSPQIVPDQDLTPTMLQKMSRNID